jgi:hypothetical protein
MKWSALAEENPLVYWDEGTEFFGIPQTSDTADRHIRYLVYKTQLVSKRGRGVTPDVSTKLFSTFE